jgi:hypothetical protein
MDSQTLLLSYLTMFMPNLQMFPKTFPPSFFMNNKFTFIFLSLATCNDHTYKTTKTKQIIDFEKSQ